MGHVQVIKVLDYIFGTLNLLAGGFIVLVFFIGAGALGLSGEANSGIGAFLFGSFGTILGGYFVLMGLLTVIAGAALGARQLWSRIYHIIIAALSLLSFPLGTAYGIYVLWALLVSPESQTMFSSGGSENGSHDSGSSGGFNF
jgi:hypothetical protein